MATAFLNGPEGKLLPDDVRQQLEKQRTEELRKKKKLCEELHRLRSYIFGSPSGTEKDIPSNGNVHL